MNDSLVVEGGGARAVLHRQTNRMRIHFQRLYGIARQVNTNEDEHTSVWVWVSFVTQSTDQVGLNFPIPVPGAPEADVLAAYEAFMNDTNTAFADDIIVKLNMLVAPTTDEQAPGDPEGADPNSSSGGEPGSKKR